MAFLWLPVPPGLATREVTRERRFVAMPAGHELAGREEVPIAALRGEPFRSAARRRAGTTRGGGREHFTYDCSLEGERFGDCVGRYV
ncbi:hypothetical protein Pth03_39380 [Planotetraspora thailandica]|uniref:LysR substrate-binding domain-containing protein n=1 Tax=Planotetraspora thailandica TaxID=487172 RepID=A0A8J3XWN7_9ACTN|nr:hypothetical protein Pth03_39380 [Planotetraspora thailandica]